MRINGIFFVKYLCDAFSSSVKSRMRNICIQTDELCKFFPMALEIALLLLLRHPYTVHEDGAAMMLNLILSLLHNLSFNQHCAIVCWTRNDSIVERSKCFSINSALAWSCWSIFGNNRLYQMYLVLTQPLNNSILHNYTPASIINHNFSSARRYLWKGDLQCVG